MDAGDVITIQGKKQPCSVCAKVIARFKAGMLAGYTVYVSTLVPLTVVGDQDNPADVTPIQPPPGLDPNFMTGWNSVQ